jgi:hypothetical protein
VPSPTARERLAAPAVCRILGGVLTLARRESAAVGREDDDVTEPTLQLPES